MQPAIQAYNKTQTLVLSQRELEARALLKAASKLQWLKENWEPSISTMDDPLSHNRQVWTIFLEAATDPQSAMPPEMRSNMIGLCRFVINQCMRMLFEPDPKKLDLMIEINQHIAAGLRGREGSDLPKTEPRKPEMAAS
ncbi:MAG: flagellar biosynthesis regulator FlaF [Methylobacterium sp.]|nr:flagellar biosynthesis regulator FlaF [Methylobacterium sp.]MCA3654565.1 flagellar biosynthesis regulator FlaF [Methylobacterium sp.]MCA3656946.1 flagellar biosynthesis regulator FlaF [Methylobacterium sp.]MCA3664824.1 flagellar biosynthesis regulator FlaF [Methylobacterium sp.]MCA3665948.1 flagellar biosynthesis regulator FlaF [Methylobacterium sp.]